MKTVEAPKYCPMCSASTEVVRHVMSNMFELACETCDRISVVLTNDFVREPSTDIRDASGRIVAPPQTPIAERPAGPWDSNTKGRP